MTQNLAFVYGYTNIIVNVAIILITILNIVVYKFRQHQEEELLKEDPPFLSLSTQRSCYRFSLEQMRRATSNFHDQLVIGEGGFGKVYKGTFKSEPTVVAIKRSQQSKSGQGSTEFQAEIEMLSRIRHSHLVSLIGYCDDGYEMILVYEFMSGGTLADHLYKRARQGDTSLTPLSWVQRLKICIGAARGLHYLHTGTGIQHRIIHRDVKTTNILLDENLAAKISDFGLSKISPANQADTFVSTHVKGTFGYFDPYYFQTHRLTSKSDVYAFGVVLFEVLCGRPAVDKSLDEEQMGLAGWAQHCFKEERLGEIIDPGIKENVFPDSLETFVKVAIQCLHTGPKHRPTMAEVVVGLESALALQEKGTENFSPEIITSDDNQEEIEISDPVIFPEQSYTLLVEDENSEKDMDDISSSRHQEKQSSALKRFFAFLTPTARAISVNREAKTSRNSDGVLSVSQQSSELKSYTFHDLSIATRNFHPRGSLKKYLIFGIQEDETGDSTEFQPLSWELRISIALGAAKGLAYLHSPGVNIIHGHVNTSNILIDSKFNAKLSNFGLANNGPEDESTHVSRVFKSTIGYLDPEYIRTGHLTMKSDVYSFGVVLLELLTGRRPVDHENRLLVNWAESRLSKERGILGIMDAVIKGQYTIEAASTASSIALKCTSRDSKSRPDAKQLVEELGQISTSKPNR